MTTGAGIQVLIDDTAGIMSQRLCRSEVSIVGDGVYMTNHAIDAASPYEILSGG